MILVEEEMVMEDARGDPKREVVANIVGGV